jgi:ketosteroid isomerase-like protein
MSEESTPLDLVERTRQAFEALTGGDLDAALSLYAPDAVWDASVNGLGTFEATEAIRAFVEGWRGSFDDYAIEMEEILDLGNGVVFAAYRESGRPTGSKGLVQERRCSIAVFVDGLVSTLTFFQHSDKARAGAERIAEGRR